LWLVYSSHQSDCSILLPSCGLAIFDPPIFLGTELGSILVGLPEVRKIELIQTKLGDS
jgi:hypothetical protein